MKTFRMVSKYSRIVVAASLISGAGLAARADQDARSNSTARTFDHTAVDKVLSGWPPGPRLAGQEMMAKYGAPREVTPDRVIWHNAGPYKRIMLTREELPHDFPLTHMDYLEHTINYNVPPDKTDDVHAFDASITIYRVAGELSARCDLESNNVLTLNLANDIVTAKKGVDEARKEFAQAVTDGTLGKAPASTMALQFKPADPGAAADREKITIPGSPQRAAGTDNAAKSGAAGTSGTPAPAKSGSDAEIMALLIALDENEVHAAMTAEEKKVSQPILAYAKTLHQDHGKNIQDTQQLGMKVGITPIETAAVDQLHAKGAEQLAKLLPLSADEFGRAFVAHMTTGHRDALQMIDQFLKSAQNDALKQHLTATRHHIELHLKEAQKLGTAKS